MEKRSENNRIVYIYHDNNIFLARFSVFNQKKRVHSLWCTSVPDEHGHRLPCLSSTMKMKALSQPNPTERELILIVFRLGFSDVQQQRQQHTAKKKNYFKGRSKSYICLSLWWQHSKRSVIDLIDIIKYIKTCFNQSTKGHFNEP